MYSLPAPGEHLRYLVGDARTPMDTRPLPPYHPPAMAFLAALSRALLADPQAKEFPDVIAFAFWCRHAHLQALQKQAAEDRVRLGLGLVFHIAPSNVEINFAYTFAFSLLAGNANIVRVPSADFAQVALVCAHMQAVLQQPEHAWLARMTVLVRYAQNDAITAEFSRNCNARVIWGGSQTIRTVSAIPLPERSVELRFSDRYSFCVIRSAAVLQATPQALQRLAAHFYNDTFLTDQNACSSPHLVIWIGNEQDKLAAQAVFWQALGAVVESKYQLQALVAMDKLVQVCQNAIDLPQAASLVRQGNAIYRVQLDALEGDVSRLRGVGGLFYECGAQDFESVAHIVTPQYQTLAYFGLDAQALQAVVVAHRLPGIDRIVPVGQTLDIGVVWDGYDVVRSLSRVLDLR